MRAAPSPHSGKPRRAPAAPRSAKLLGQAEQLCLQRGVRFTPQRRRVLELILEAAQPVGAYTLLTELKGPAAKMGPPTIYRALEFLLEQRFIHRIVSLNAFVACLDVDHPHESQFLICTACRATEEIHIDKISRTLDEEIRARGYKVDRQMVEVSGLCPRCRAG
jgi:Fur family zinc uptake transcriptional regulator